MTYNVNWGMTRPELAAQAILENQPDIVCLQETTPDWEGYLRQTLARHYPMMEFRHGEHRMAGGLAFLSKLPRRDVAYVPSETTWFSGWVAAFETPAGPIQIINVHLRPKVNDAGRFGPSGYFGTGDERLREIERLFEQRQRDLPTLVAGDFNEGENSGVLRWLESHGLTSALGEFDRYSPTWRWRTSVVSLKQRLDHIAYPPELHCYEAGVSTGGASDHLPVVAVFGKKAQ
jgi:endonuclease/exonuclease/phosphatase family metal-dependent hydrolase